MAAATKIDLAELLGDMEIGWFYLIKEKLRADDGLREQLDHGKFSEKTYLCFTNSGLAGSTGTIRDEPNVVKPKKIMG